MNTKTFFIHKLGLITLAALILGTVVTFADEMTAFQLIKEGNKHVGEDAKDRIVGIRSEKSILSLQPNIWYIVYYDPDARLKATEVKFGAGKKLDVKRPFRLLEPITGADKELPKDKLKIDSDKAIAIALEEPLLDKLTIKATRLWLEKKDDVPAWKVRLYAQKLKNPNDTADIGEVYVATETGKVLERDLHINRID
jgi:hypothetical protein